MLKLAIHHLGRRKISGDRCFPELGKIDKTDVVMLELSSYMLDYLGAMHWSPHVSLVTMIAADHLEWHGSREAYAESKEEHRSISASEMMWSS